MQSYANIGVSASDVVRIFAIAATCARSWDAGASGYPAEYVAAFGEWRASGDGCFDVDRTEEAVEAITIGGRLSRLSRRRARAAFVYEYVCRVQVWVGVIRNSRTTIQQDLIRRRRRVRHVRIDRPRARLIRAIFHCEGD